MQKNKILIMSISALIILILIGGGAFYYYRYYLPKNESEKKQAMAEQAAAKADIDFSGQLVSIDLSNNFLSAAISEAESPIQNFSQLYSGKTYKFKINDQTKIYQIKFTVNFDAGKFITDPNYVNTFNNENKKPLSLSDLKIGDKLEFYVSKEELNKKDEFLVNNIVLIISE